MNGVNSLDGIISYLTNKYGGNVHEKGIVTMTSKSVLNDDLKNALKNSADLTSGSAFMSKGEPGQWVCWDFLEGRVRPTQYTIWAVLLKSWVVEGSLDGESWTEIDRRTGDTHFNRVLNKAFVVAKEVVCRFIRLTQTGKTYSARDTLDLIAVEFFGTLSEPTERCGTGSLNGADILG
jgi:hypothetical protein